MRLLGSLKQYLQILLGLKTFIMGMEMMAS
jgi:hypothetical protein